MGQLGFLFFVLIVLASAGMKLDREYQRGLIYRLGRVKGVMGPGIYWIIPVVDQKTQVDLRTRTVDIEPQETVTADSVTIKVNAVLYYRILDPIRAINKVENYQLAVYQAAMTTLRNVIGQNILDDMLQNRDKINFKVQEIVDQITEPWGIEIERVEMKDVEIPPNMQRAMAKEAEAIREKRARLIKAEAEYEASSKLAAASQNITQNPAALELRRLQMLSEIGTENNTTTIVMIPSDILPSAQLLTGMLHPGGVSKSPQPVTSPEALPAATTAEFPGSNSDQLVIPPQEIPES